MSNFYERIRKGICSFLEPKPTLDFRNFIIDDQQARVRALTQERHVLIDALGLACCRLSELQNNPKESDPSFWIDIAKKTNF